MEPFFHNQEANTDSIESSLLLDTAPGFEVDANAMRRKQVEMVFGQLPWTLLADVVTGSFLFALLITTSEGPLPILWFGVLLLGTAVRAVFANYYKRCSTQIDVVSAKLRFLYIEVLASGIFWGCSWTLLPADASLMQEGSVVLWLCGLLSGAATTLSVIKKLYFAFAIPYAALLIGYLLYIGGDTELLLVSAMGLYLVFITPIVLRVSSDLNTGIKLQLQCESLYEKVVAEEAMLKEKGAQLMAQHRREIDLKSENVLLLEDLENARKDFQLALNMATDGIIGINRLGTISFANRSALDILQFSEEELIGEKATRLIDMDNGECNSGIAECLENGETAENLNGIFKNNDGVALLVKFSCIPIWKQADVTGTVISFSVREDLKDQNHDLPLAK